MIKYDRIFRCGEMNIDLANSVKKDMVEALVTSEENKKIVMNQLETMGVHCYEIGKYKIKKVRNAKWLMR